MVKNFTNAGDAGLMLGRGRSPEEGSGNPLQYSCLGNPIDRGACGLQSMGSQRVGHDLAIKQQYQDSTCVRKPESRAVLLACQPNFTVSQT